MHPGANAPAVDSVTLAFHNRGWRGINVKPVEAFTSHLQGARRGDINVRLVATAAPGRVRFFDIAGTTLSATEPKIAERRCPTGHTITEIDVEADTFARICAARRHFLKIDVEGGAPGVIEGLDLEWVRPWITLVDATDLMPQVPDSHCEPCWVEQAHAEVREGFTVQVTGTRIAAERAYDREHRLGELQRQLRGAGGGSGTVAGAGR